MSRRSLLTTILNPIPVMEFVIDTSLGNGLSRFSIPIGGPENFRTMQVDWGDGTEDIIKTYNDPLLNHNYGVGGVYTIRIKARVVYWSSSLGSDSAKITKMIKWGGIGGNFRMQGAENADFSEVEDIPNLKYTDSFERLFDRCYSMTTVNRVNEWSTEHINNMSHMWRNCHLFNQDLSYNTLNVETMEYKFFGGKDFNGQLLFTTPKLKNVGSMFVDAWVFNQPLDWGPVNIEVMNAFMARAYKFNQPLDNFNTSQVVNFNDVLHTTRDFNQPLNWDFSSGRQYARFMTGLNSTQYSPENYDILLQRWDEGGQEDVTGVHMNNINFTAIGEVYKNNLIAKGWSITDGGLI